MTKRQIAFLSIFLVLIIDQVSKIWIKTHFTLGESVVIFPWFRILFIENNGMAFGIEILGKLFLSLFRVVAIYIGLHNEPFVIKTDSSSAYRLYLQGQWGIS